MSNTNNKSKTMETKDTFSSCSISKDQEIQRLQEKPRLSKGSSMGGLKALQSHFKSLSDDLKDFSGVPTFISTLFVIDIRFSFAYVAPHVVFRCVPNLGCYSNNGREADQDDLMLKNKHELLASLIEQMKHEIDESKKTNKSLESSNKALREATTFLNIELKRYQDTDFVKNARLKCATAYGLLKEQKVKTEKSFSAYTEKNTKFESKDFRNDKRNVCT
ncbi:hypothetical protein Tco_1043841 [Tanacetum coccineum]|uniref:Uncharacterized protein n=1 Tax=Tanacetum coccineum TaxID=301880 RepID=A0ABQ5GN75_9ASTR